MLFNHASAVFILQLNQRFGAITPPPAPPVTDPFGHPEPGRGGQPGCHTNGMFRMMPVDGSAPKGCVPSCAYRITGTSLWPPISRGCSAIT
jgi:hypothetical protein